MIHEPIIRNLVKMGMISNPIVRLSLGQMDMISNPMARFFLEEMAMISNHMDRKKIVLVN